MDAMWLHSFVETARLKSLSKASEALNLTQPAVSKQIRKLEEAYGVELFTRTASGVELTDAGAFLYERIVPVLAELNAIASGLKSFQKQPSIVLGTLPSLASRYLPQPLVRLREGALDVQVRIVNTTDEALHLLQSGDLDAALVEARNAPASLWKADLFIEPFFAVLPERHPLTQQEAIFLHDLRDEPLVVYEPSCDIRNRIVRAYQARGWEPRIAAELPFRDFIFGFVAAGTGLTLVPRLLADAPLPPGTAVRPLADFPYTRTISLLAHAEKTGKSLLRSFS